MTLSAHQLTDVPRLVLSVQDPLGRSGIDKTGSETIYLTKVGGINTTENLNNLVCRYFKIKGEEEKRLFKAAIFSAPDIFDRITLVSNDDVAYKISIEGKNRRSLRMSQNAPSQEVKLRPQKLCVRLGMERNDIQFDVSQELFPNAVNTQGNSAIAFFNCKSFKKMAQFNTNTNFCRFMQKTDIVQLPSRL